MRCIKGLILFLSLVTVMGFTDGDLSLVESHGISPDSNFANMSFAFTQGGVNEQVTFSFYNSNPDIPVAILVINEGERNEEGIERNDDQVKERTYHLNKTLTFYPRALGDNQDATFSFEFNDSEKVREFYSPENSHLQTRLSIEVSVVWNSESLWVSITPKGGKTQVIDIIDFARKRNFKLDHSLDISRVEIESGQPGTSVLFSHEYKLMESLKLMGVEGLKWMGVANLKLLGSKKLESYVVDKYPLPNNYQKPTLGDIGKSITKRLDQVVADGMVPVYLVTPYVYGGNQTPDMDMVKNRFRWDTTSVENDRIYDLAVSSYYGLLRDWESKAVFDTEEKTLKGRCSEYVIDQEICIRPKDSDLNVHWRFGVMMREIASLSHYICEYQQGVRPECVYFSSVELGLSVDQRVLMFGRNGAGELKAFVGGGSTEAIDLSRKFETIKNVEELEFSLNVR